MEGFLISVLPLWEVPGWRCPQERLEQDLGAAVGLGPLSPAGQVGPGLHALPAPGLRRLGLEEERQLSLRQPACAP